MKTYEIEFDRTPAYSLSEFGTEIAHVKAETKDKARERFISEMAVIGCSFNPPNEHWDKLELIRSVEEYEHNSLFETEDQDFYVDNTLGGIR